jgi:signal transduction histidine kinase
MNKESNGLGLSICKMLALELGGDLSCSSADQKTVFDLQLMLQSVKRRPGSEAK